MWINIFLTIITGGILLFLVHKVYNKINGSIASQRHTLNKNGARVILGLEKRGYFRYADEASIVELKEEIIRAYNQEGIISTVLDERALSEEEVSIPRCYRLYNCDTEFLYEGGFSKIFSDVENSFFKMGLSFEVTNFIESDSEEGFSQSVTINGTNYIIFENFDDESSGWEEAFDSLMYILNAELENQRSNERVYAIGKANDTQIIFLTKTLFEYIRKLNLNIGSKPRLWKTSK